MINRKTSAFLTGVFLAFYTGAVVMADDTEIYDGSGGSAAATPLVMFTIDYAPPVLMSTASCTDPICTDLISGGYLASATTTRFGLLIAALKYIINDLSGMKIGLMMSHNADNNCASPSESSSCSGGGYILMGFEEITASAWNVDAAKSKFFTKLDALQTLAAAAGGSDTHTFQGKEVFFEFFRYITGHNAYNSHLGYTDYGTNNTQNLIEDNTDLMRDLDIEGITLVGGGSPTSLEKAQNIAAYNTPGTYTSPITEDCQKIFTLNFLKGVTNQEDDSDTAIKTGTKASGAMEGISLSGKSNNLESVLEYLEGSDFGDGTWGLDDAHRPENEDTPGDYVLEGTQNVTSYFIVDGSGLNTGHDWAQAGGTPAAIEWTDDPQDVVDQIQSIFSQILSTSTTFTAASVPVSVLNRAQIVDNVYIALFKSDPDGFETWPGNVKRLKLDTDIGTLVDVNGDSAINPNDGRIINSALTFWTDTSTLPSPDLTNDEVAGKDGRAVKRGGAGQQIPGFDGGGGNTIGTENSSTTRTIYYEPDSVTLPFTLAGSTPGIAELEVHDDTATELLTDLGAADLTEAKKFLRYIRGFDVSIDPTNETTPRSWILGDPLHSRPLPINYGNSNPLLEPDIRLVFGSNDGMFHMIKNSVTNSTTALGEETWAFMPRATMGIVEKLITNDGSNDHPYGVDGAPAALIIDQNNDGVINAGDSDVVGVFFGLRRGGRAMYALDISAPDSPKFQWSKDNTSSGFSELGYTFSQPKVAYVDIGGGSIPVIMFAGGYDLSKDDQIPHDGTSDSMGRAFYVVNAQTGDLIWKVENGTTGNVSATEYNHADMDDSIPSTVTTADTDGDGLTDRAYVGDTGGRVWRFDMIGTNRSTWKATVIASVGYRDSNVAGNDRRFFHRPDFIQFKDADGDYDAVVIASGNRAHPMKDTVNDDFLYVIKDRNTSGVSTVTDPVNHSDGDEFYDVTDNCLQDGGCSDTTADINAKLYYGWKLEFEEVGEKSLATPTTLAKKVFVTTYLPEGGTSSGACTPSEGAGRLYALNLADASAVNDYDVSNGDDMEKTDRHTDLDSGGIPAEVVYVPFNRILKPDLSIEDVGVSGRWKTYWYKKEN